MVDMMVISCYQITAIRLPRLASPVYYLPSLCSRQAKVFYVFCRRIVANIITACQQKGLDEIGQQMVSIINQLPIE